MDPAWVLAKYGVPARAYVDFAVLRGDPSDGLPGVKGIGDKSAAQSVFQQSVAIVDRIADKKIVHKNKASRTKSRLSAQIKALAAA